MATVSNPKVAILMSEFFRPTTEIFIGLRKALEDDLSYLNESGITEPSDSVISTSGIFDFTATQFLGYQALIGQLTTANPAIEPSIQALKVRHISILANMFAVNFDPSMTALQKALMCVRLHAPVIRKLLFECRKALEFIPTLLVGYEASDIIDEGRPNESLPMVTVGNLLTFCAFVGGMLALNDTQAAGVVDSACGTLLKVEAR